MNYNPKFEAEADIDGYAGRFRNNHKRHYAELYGAWRLGEGLPFDFNGGPEDSANEIVLSAFSRRCIRQHIDEIMRWHFARY